MSAEAISFCWGESFPEAPEGVGSAPFRLVALAIADVVNDMHEHRFYGSLPRIAEKTGLNRDTVRRAVNGLVEAGVIEVLEEREGSTTVYRWVHHPAVPPRGTPRSGRGEGAVPPRGTPRSGRGEGAVPPRGPRGPAAPNSIELEDELQGELSHPHPEVPMIVDGEQVWEGFWTMYPRKVGKPAARKAFMAALKRGAVPFEILDGLRAHLDHGLAERGQFIPHPATWLNQERWADPPEDALPATRSKSVTAIDRVFSR